MAEAAKPRRITDVSSPGESAPNASSRPIIISQKPSVQDPMVGNPAVLTDKNTVEKLPVSHPNPQVQPQAPPEPETQPPSPIPTQSSQVQTAENNPSPAHIKQLVHDRTYFMPVTQPPRRNGALWFLVAMAGVLVAAVAGYIALTT